MIGNRKTIWTLLFSTVLLFACISLVACSQKQKLTQIHGMELQTAYEDFAHAVTLAYETGNTSLLQNTATGYELRHHLETARTKAAAEAALEWWKIEVIYVTVREYSSTTAEMVVEQRSVGDVSVITEQDRRSVRIVRFQRVDGKWKVSNIYSYFTL